MEAHNDDRVNLLNPSIHTGSPLHSPNRAHLQTDSSPRRGSISSRNSIRSPMSLTNSNKTINTLYKESTRHGSNPLITGHSSASIMSGSADSGSNDGNRFTSISMRESLSSNLSGKVIRDSLSTQDVTDERETDGFGGDNNRSNAFERDMQEGFTSNNFDLSENVEAEDQRAGLVDSEKNELRHLMSEGLDFDSARLQMNLERMQSAGIDPSTGLPMDSRAVTFESLRNTNNNIQQSSRRGGDILRRSDNWKKKFMAIANRIGLSPQKLVAVTVVTLVLYFLLRHTDLIFPDYVDDTGILNNTEE